MLGHTFTAYKFEIFASKRRTDESSGHFGKRNNLCPIRDYSSFYGRSHTSREKLLVAVIAPRRICPHGHYLFFRSSWRRSKVSFCLLRDFERVSRSEEALETLRRLILLIARRTDTSIWRSEITQSTEITRSVCSENKSDALEIVTYYILTVYFRLCFFFYPIIFRGWCIDGDDRQNESSSLTYLARISRRSFVQKIQLLFDKRDKV